MAQNRLWQTMYVGFVAVLALLILAFGLLDLRGPDPWSLLVFLVLAFAANGLTVELPGRALVVYDVIVVLPAVVLFGPIPGAAIGALANILWRTVGVVRRDTSLLASVLSAGQLVVSYALAGGLYHHLVPASPGFWATLGVYLLALLVFKVMNALFVDQIYNRLYGLYERARFVRTFFSEGAIYLATAPLGVLMVLIYPFYGLYGVVLSFAPVLIASYALHRYVQGQRLNQLLEQRADQLTQILRVSETLRTDLDLDFLLSRVAQAVRESLGFNVVLLSLYDEAQGMFARRAAAGIPAAEYERLHAQSIPAQEFLRFFDERFRVGRCYLARLAGEEQASYSYTRPFPPAVERDAWRADDLLLVPMIGRYGELIGVISADDPPDGRRPQAESLYALEIFANQAAQAIENVRLYNVLRQRLVSLEEANERIQQAQEELSQHSRKLEEMVAQRTGQLEERSRQLEAALQRATEADHLKSEFLANMSHELRTPLNSIIGFSRVILNQIDGPITDLQRTDLTAIYNSGVHLLGLINDILDLSKIEAGRMELRKESVDLGPVVKGVLNTSVPLVQDKPVQLLERIPVDLPPVYADPTRVRQIILNLVSNAIKYTDRGLITVSAYHRDSEVVVAVSDTGTGIALQDLPKVFEPFRQVGRTVERRAMGTGLGLAISQRFVEMHGGRMWAESELGQGSTFFFTLPVMSSSRVLLPKGVEEEPAAVPSSRTVLVVDDDPEVISCFRRYLEEHGFQVIGATDAVEALRLAWEEHPYAITLDILLPDEDGWTVLRALKEDKATQDIPVIICSVLQERDIGFALGATDYLGKPVSQEELVAALERLRRPAGRIVVIDDQAEELQWMSCTLMEQGQYEVVSAISGEEGLVAIQQHRPDLVILDLSMPGLDGFAVLGRLKADRRVRSIPVLVVTEGDLTPADERLLDGRVAGLLHRRLFSTQDLLADVARVLQVSLNRGHREEVGHAAGEETQDTVEQGRVT